MKKLYQFDLYCGRQGELTSVFAAEEETVAAALGKTVNFGEVLGKHSHITTVLQESQLQVCSDDQEFIDQVEALNILPTGHCPLNYIDWNE